MPLTIFFGTILLHPYFGKSLKIAHTFSKLALSPWWDEEVETQEEPIQHRRTVPLLSSAIRRNWRTWTALMAIIADFAVLTAAFLTAAQLQHPGVSLTEVFASHAKFYFFFLIVFLVSFTSVGIYRTVSYIPLKQHLLAATKAFIYSTAIILSTLSLYGNLFYSREFLIALFAVFPQLYFATWLLLHQVFRWSRQRGYGRWNTLLIGPSKNIDQLLTRLRAYPTLGYEPVSILKTPVRGTTDGKLHVKVKDIEREIRALNVDYLVLTSPDLNGSYDELEALCRQHFVRMRVVSPETDTLFRQVRIFDLAGLPLYSPRRQRIDGARRLVKRSFDVVVAAVLLVLCSPIFLIVAIATKLESHGPVFFKQLRSLSDRDTPFWFYKFRSMHHEADERKESLFPKNESNGALFKMKDDPRVTRVGKVLRRYSIDELPQLINVLTGEMSLVGPRPLPVGDFARVTAADDIGGYFRARANAKPGMTGLWQISGRSHLGFRDMVMLDLYYIEHQSLLFDIEILAQTIPVVLFGKGAY